MAYLRINIIQKASQINEKLLKDIIKTNKIFKSYLVLEDLKHWCILG